MKLRIIFIYALLCIFSEQVFAQTGQLTILDSVSLEEIFEPHDLIVDTTHSCRTIPEVSFRFSRVGEFLWLYSGKKIIKYNLKNKKKEIVKYVEHFVKSDFYRVIPGDSLILTLDIKYDEQREMFANYRFRFYDYNLKELPEKSVETNLNFHLEMPEECSAFNYEFFFYTHLDIVLITTQNVYCYFDRTCGRFNGCGGASRLSVEDRIYYERTVISGGLKIEFEGEVYTLKDANKYIKLGFLLDKETYMNCSDKGIGGNYTNTFKIFDLKTGNSFFSFKVSNFILPRNFMYNQSIISYVKSSERSFLYNNHVFKREAKGKNYIYQFEMPKR
jgi:hypothetical protein